MGHLHQPSTLVAPTARPGARLAHKARSAKVLATFIGRCLLPGRPRVSTPGRLVLLLSFPRAGTEMFGTILENAGQPFAWYGELFGFRSTPPNINAVAARVPGFGHRYLRGWWATRSTAWFPFIFEARGMDPLVVADALAAGDGVAVVKLFSDTLRPETLDALLATRRPAVVFLRRDHRARYTSFLRAKATGEWQQVSTSHVEVHVDEAELLADAAEKTAWYEALHRRCEELELEIIDLSYRQLFDRVRLATVIEQLSGGTCVLDPAAVPAPSTRRQNPDLDRCTPEADPWIADGWD